MTTEEDQLSFADDGRDAVMELEAARILQNRQFVASPTLTRLLTWLVAETLAGRGDAIKSYTIAVDGLGRDEDFDSKADSYPRVQIGRLKRALETYYAQVGPAKDLCLYLQHGSYRVRLGSRASAYPQLYHRSESLELRPALNATRQPVMVHAPGTSLFSTILVASAAVFLVFLAVLAAIVLAPEIEIISYETVKHSIPASQFPNVCVQRQSNVGDAPGRGSLWTVDSYCL